MGWGGGGQPGECLYANAAHNRIKKFDANGVYLTQWGSNGSGNGQFSSPSGVAVDGQGNVYVADTENKRIQQFTSGGMFLST